MRERPIRFEDQMIQSIVHGRKTQTRRVVKTDLEQFKSIDDMSGHAIYCRSEDDEKIKIECSHGQVGDRFWVRETWTQAWTIEEGDKENTFVYQYKADSKSSLEPDKWRPSITMPEDACRLRLEITNIKVERLQDISQSDIKAEGVEGKFWSRLFRSKVSINKFIELWDNIYGQASFEPTWLDWASNPFVWVISFKRIDV